MLPNAECCVCGRPAIGIHYGIIACGGCGAFYKRGVKQKIKYHCYFGGECSTRANSPSEIGCKACRFWKCVRLGMRLQNRKSAEKSPSRSNSTGTRRGSPDDTVWRCPDSGVAVDIDISPVQSDSTDSDREPKKICHTESHNMYMTLPIAVHSPSQLTLHTNGENLMYNNHLVTSTILAVEAAVQTVFGDQLRTWTAYKERAFQHFEENQRPTSLNEMAILINGHINECYKRTRKFLAAMPGINQLDTTALAQCTRLGWKYFVLWMLHHAPFLTDMEAFFTMGPQEIRYFQRWEETASNSESTVNDFAYMFCAQFRDIGLEQTEQYLLMAVVICEPVKENHDKGSSQLQILHRHYADALLEALKRRCHDMSQVSFICRKLERFLSVLKMAYWLYQHYYGSSTLCPPIVFRDLCPAETVNLISRTRHPIPVA